MNSTRAQWMVIIGGFLVLVLVTVVLGAIVGATTQQSSEDAQQASTTNEAATEEEPVEEELVEEEPVEEEPVEEEPVEEEPVEEELTVEEPTTEEVPDEVVEEDFESFEEQEARRKRAISEARTPEERVRAIVEHMPEFEKLEPNDPKRVWVRFYDDNGCLDTLVKYRRISDITFGLGTQADWIESEMWQIYKAIHADRVAHEAICDVSVEAYGDITDDYGQATEKKLYETSLSRDVAARVNWSNATSANYTELWQVDYVHPQVEAERVQGNAQQALDCLQEGGMFDFDWLECP